MGYGNHNELQEQKPATLPTTCAPPSTAVSTTCALKTVPVPEIGPGEVLILVHCCGVCGPTSKRSHPAPIPHPASSATKSPASSQPPARASGIPGRRPRHGFHHTPAPLLLLRKRPPPSAMTTKRAGVTAGSTPGGGLCRICPRHALDRRPRSHQIPDGVRFGAGGLRRAVNTSTGAFAISISSRTKPFSSSPGPIGILLAALAPAPARRSSPPTFTRHATPSPPPRSQPPHPTPAKKTWSPPPTARAKAAEPTPSSSPSAATPSSARMDAARPGGRVLLFAATRTARPLDPPSSAWTRRR